MAGQKSHLVLLCGLLCDRRIWDPVANHLDDITEASIFSFAGFDDLSAMAAHVLANTEGTFALAGHSMGGRVAIEVIKQAPDRVSKLALLNTGVHPKRDSEVPGRQKLLDMSVTEGMQAVCETWLLPMVGAKGKQNETLMADLRDMVVSHSAEQFKGEIQALLNRPEAESVLRDVTVDTLLLSSNEDNWSPISQHRDMQALLSNSSLVALEGVGHMSTIEAPQAVASALRDWLIR